MTKRKPRHARKRPTIAPEVCWVTRDGRRVPVHAMETMHLVHEKWMASDALHALAYASTAPEMASYCAEGEGTALLRSMDKPEAQLNCLISQSGNIGVITRAMVDEVKQRKQLTPMEIILS